MPHAEQPAPRGAVTTTEAAAALGVTPRRVVALIGAGRLPATKLGRDWLIRSTDLAKVRERKAGRPRLTK